MLQIGLGIAFALGVTKVHFGVENSYLHDGNDNDYLFKEPTLPPPGR